MKDENLDKDNITKKEMTFEQIDSTIKKLSVRKSLLVDKSLRSNDVDSIVKAQEYLQKQDKAKQSQFKSFIYSPEHEFYNGMGYKASLKSISYDLMRAMARTPQINAIIQTRIEQVLNFSEFQTDLQREGWSIVKKLSRFEKLSNYELKDKDKQEIDRIVNFLENGGNNAKWDMADDFDEFLRKYVKDSLELDQSVMEIERTRGGELFRYAAKPSDTYRILETIDPNEFNKEKYRYDEVNGYLPIYAQVWRGRIAERNIPGTDQKEQIVFYPWELNFGVRNKSTYIRNNGYGKSELEILVEIVTWMLYGMQYNGNFFKQGSNPKGFFTIEGDADKDVLNEFRSSWKQTIAGISNSHRIPIFEGQSKINWVDMQHMNKDMEFENWNDFLLLIACSVYRIDPQEIGYTFKSKNQPYGQKNQEERIKHSKEKGLKPLLKFVQKQINKFLVSELNPAYEFKFTGIDLEDETAMLDNDVKKATAGFVSHEDMFEKYSNRKFNPDKDTILSPIYVQTKQLENFGGLESNAAVDKMTGDKKSPPNPNENYEKGENPIMDASLDYIQKNLIG